MCTGCYKIGLSCVYRHSSQNNSYLSEPRPTSNFHTRRATVGIAARLRSLEDALPQAPNPQNGIPGTPHLPAYPGLVNLPPFDPRLINHQPVHYDKTSVSQDGNHIYSPSFATGFSGPQWTSTPNSPDNTIQQAVTGAIDGGGAMQNQDPGYDFNLPVERSFSDTLGEIAPTDDNPMDVFLDFGGLDFPADYAPWSYGEPRIKDFFSAALGPGPLRHSMEHTDVLQPNPSYMHPCANGSTASVSEQGVTNAAMDPGSVPSSVSTGPLGSSQNIGTEMPTTKSAAETVCTCIQESVRVTSRFWIPQETGRAGLGETTAACLRVLSCQTCIRTHTGRTLGSELPDVCVVLRGVLSSSADSQDQGGGGGGESLQPGNPATLSWLQAQLIRLNVLRESAPEQGSMKDMIEVLCSSALLGQMYEAERQMIQRS
jgi:hypothetical protein